MEPDGKALFDAISPSVPVLTGTVANTPRPIDWIPVVTLVPEAEEFVGLGADGYWLAEGRHGGLYIVDRAEKYYILFRLMERPVKQIAEEITASPQLRAFSNEIVEAFPFVGIIRAGLRSAGTHWMDYAFAWIAELPLRLRVSLSDELEEIRTSRAGQKFRHRAQKELARIRRETESPTSGI